MTRKVITKRKIIITVSYYNALLVNKGQLNLSTPYMFMPEIFFVMLKYWQRQ